MVYLSAAINTGHEMFTQNKLINRNLPTPMAGTSLFRVQVLSIIATAKDYSLNSYSVFMSMSLK